MGLFSADEDHPDLWEKPHESDRSCTTDKPHLQNWEENEDELPKSRWNIL